MSDPTPPIYIITLLPKPGNIRRIIGWETHLQTAVDNVLNRHVEPKDVEFSHAVIELTHEGVNPQTETKAWFMFNNIRSAWEPCNPPKDKEEAKNLGIG